MNRKDLEDYLMGNEVILLDPEYMDDALIGITTDYKAVYSYNKLIEVLIKNKISEDEVVASDYICNEIMSAYVDENQPIIMDTEFFDYKSDNDKNEILKRFFVTGEMLCNDFDWHSHITDYSRKQNKLTRKYTKIKRMYGWDCQEGGIVQDGNNVLAKIKGSVSLRMIELKAARKEANKAFTEYMNYKDCIRTGKLYYKDKDVKKKYDELKDNWIKASREVQIRKCLLNQDRLILSKFIEYLDTI